jgi:hypothetical protein
MRIILTTGILADTIGNIMAVPAAAFLFYAVQKTVRQTKLAVLTLDFFSWCLYELVFSMTLDWWDILDIRPDVL